MALENLLSFTCTKCTIQGPVTQFKIPDFVCDNSKYRKSRTTKYIQENTDNEFLENILRVVTDPVGGLNWSAVHFPSSWISSPGWNSQILQIKYVEQDQKHFYLLVLYNL